MSGEPETPMQTTEEQIVVALKSALADVTDPAQNVVEGAQQLAMLPAGTVQIMPAALPRASGTTAETTWGLELIVATCEKLVSPTETGSAYSRVFTQAAAVRDALRSEETLSALRTAGARDVKRSEPVFWAKPGGPGQPAGMILQVTVYFTAAAS